MSSPRKLWLRTGVIMAAISEERTMTKATDAGFGPGWEALLLRELADEGIAEANAEESNAALPAHELMTAEEVCTNLRMTARTLYRYTKARKLAYIKRDGRLLFQ